MKKAAQFIIPATALLLTLGACKKETSNTPTPINTPTSNTPPTPIPGDVNGALFAIKMTTTVQGFDLATDIGGAVFYTTPGATTYVDAGAVTINSNALDKQTGNSYSKVATVGQTPATLGIDNTISWSVAGANGIPAISYDHTGSFPDYTGDVPTSITKASGQSFTFSSSNVSNADSVYVFIVSGSKSVLKHYGPAAGTVTISAADLADLPAVADNTAIIEVLPFTYTIQSISGKSFAFIKERAVVKSININ